MKSAHRGKIRLEVKSRPPEQDGELLGQMHVPAMAGTWPTHERPFSCIRARKQADEERMKATHYRVRAKAGERGGTRTRDPMIKSHVLYHLSYALVARLCTGGAPAGQ
jgi:hypothetical protein